MGDLIVLPASAIIFVGVARLKKLVLGTGNPNRRSVRVRRLSLLFAVGFVYSFLLASYNHHDGGIVRSDCPLCKFALDFSSADAVATAPSLMPDYIYTSLVENNFICFCGICPASLTNRAPPALATL